MELQQYLGNTLMQDIKDEAIEKSTAFSKGNGTSKLELADQNKFQLEVYKSATKHLINVVDMVGAENEQKDNELDYYHNKFGDLDPEFVKSEKAVVVRTEEKLHAKRAFSRYMMDYEKEKKNNEDNNNKNKVK